MRRRLLIWLAAVAGLVFLISGWLTTELRIDRCIDAGGRWDYERRACEGNQY